MCVALNVADAGRHERRLHAMAVYDESQKGYRVFIGDLGHYVGRYDVEREFEEYGPIRDVWIARNPPGFAFVVYKYPADAERAVRQRHGGTVCGRRVRVEHARPFEERLKEVNTRGRYNAKSRSRSRSPRPSRSRRSRSRSRRRSSPSSKSRSKRHRTRFRSRSRSKSRSKRSRSRSRSKSRQSRADLAPAQCNHGPTKSNHGRQLRTWRQRKVGPSNQNHQPHHNHLSRQSHSHPLRTERLPNHNYLQPLCHLCQLMCSHLQQPTSRATKSGPLGKCRVTGRETKDNHYQPDWKPVFHPVANVGPSGGIMSGSSKKRVRSSSHGSRSRSWSRSKEKSKSSKKHSRSSSTHRRSNESEKEKEKKDRDSRASGEGDDAKNANSFSEDKNKDASSPKDKLVEQQKQEQNLPSNGKQEDSDAPEVAKEEESKSGNGVSTEAEAILGNGVVEKKRSRKERYDSGRTSGSSEDSD